MTIQELDERQQRAEAYRALMQLPDEDCLRMKRSVVLGLPGKPSRWEQWSYLSYAYVARMREQSRPVSL